MTASELRDLIVHRLAKERGGGTTRWRRVIGPLQVYSRTTHAHCNWEARPSGPAQDVIFVEKIVDTLRSDYPFVEDDRRTA
jgi:hypothetical protein